MRHTLYFRSALTFPLLLPLPLWFIQPEIFAFLFMVQMFFGLPYFVFYVVVWRKQLGMSKFETINFSIRLPLLFCPFSALSGLILFSIDAGAPSILEALAAASTLCLYTLGVGYFYILIAFAFYVLLVLIGFIWLKLRRITVKYKK